MINSTQYSNKLYKPYILSDKYYFYESLLFCKVKFIFPGCFSNLTTIEQSNLEYFARSFDLINGFHQFFSYPLHEIFNGYYNVVNTNSLQNITTMDIQGNDFGGLVAHFFLVSIIQNLQIFAKLKQINIKLNGSIGTNRVLAKELTTLLQKQLNECSKAQLLDINIEYILHSHDIVTHCFNPFIFVNLNGYNNIKYTLKHLVLYSTNSTTEYFSEIIYKKGLQNIVNYYKPFIVKYEYLDKPNVYSVVLLFTAHLYGYKGLIRAICSLLLCNFNSIHSLYNININYNAANINIINYFNNFYNTLVARKYKNTVHIYKNKYINLCFTALFIVIVIRLLTVAYYMLYPIIKLQSYSKNNSLLKIIVYLFFQTLQIVQIINAFIVLCIVSCIKWKCNKLLY